ncbi:hypothetical protein HJC99_02420 [Candidatus Saccharibacteria bacterium]|nr:hypothetical protein [Candidatus Saccharibacteria bacterium]
MKIIVDHAQVDLVLGRLMEVYSQRGYPYNRSDVTVPQDALNLPPDFRDPLVRDNRAYSVFLWCLCYYMRGGIKSNIAASSLGKVYAAHPDWFDTAKAKLLEPSYIETELKKFGLGFKAAEIGRIWVENSLRLDTRYHGDPREIFAGVSSYDEACLRIRNAGHGRGFMGFQFKMVSMIIYFLMDEKLIDFFYFPVPVDFHVLRVITTNQLVRFEDIPSNGNVFCDDLLQTARGLLESYARREHVNPLRLCDALWLLSGNLCNDYPGNTASVDRKRQGRRTLTTIWEPLWNDNDLRAYARSCGSCPIEQTCNGRVLSAEYYVGGTLKPRFPRIKPPVMFAMTAGMHARPQGARAITPRELVSEVNPTPHPALWDN